MKDFKIRDGWYIRSEAYGFSIIRKRKVMKKDSLNYGKFQEDAMGYYSSLLHAFNAYPDLYINNSEDDLPTALREATKDLQAAKASIAFAFGRE